jgi:hypothetical protein
MGCNCIKAFSKDVVFLDVSTNKKQVNIISPSKSNTSKLVSESEDRTLSRTNPKLGIDYPRIFDSQAFALRMLEEFNLVRENPQNYAQKIKSYCSYIKFSPKINQTVFNIPKIIKINLKNQQAFDKCIESLSQYKPVPRLELREELKFDYPYEKPELCTDKGYLNNNFMEMNMRVKNKFSVLGFHYDININDPEISTLLQVVDDNNSNGQRRKQILDKDVRYVGISSGFLRDNIICIYVVFAS